MAELNQIPAVAVTRSPRGAVKVAGDDGVAVFVTCWTSWDVDNNATRNADTFRVEFAASNLPIDQNLDWFTSQKSITVEILAGFPSDPANVQISDMTSLIFGEVDNIYFNPVQGTLELSGRDFTAKLIDTKTSDHYANQTASQIATTIAVKYGLTPIVTATKATSGVYYKEDHITTKKMQSEWELLTTLADDENYLLYVRGKELHFEPKPSESDSHYIIQWNAQNDDRGFAISNTIDLQFLRSLTIAKGVIVEVRSWNSKQKNGFSAFYPKAARAAPPDQSTGKTQLYKYKISGLTPEAAQQRAQALYSQIVQHEVRLTAYLPGDQLLDSTKTILVRGTNSKFDQVYFLESVRRTMSVHEGYRMNIRAKNKRPETEA